MDDIEKELERERENADRLSAALLTALHHLRSEELADLRDAIIGMPSALLLVGHVIDGAIALHLETKRRRS